MYYCFWLESKGETGVGYTTGRVVSELDISWFRSRKSFVASRSDKFMLPLCLEVFSRITLLRTLHRLSAFLVCVRPCLAEKQCNDVLCSLVRLCFMFIACKLY